jgi:hypothetical protein
MELKRKYIFDEIIKYRLSDWMHIHNYKKRGGWVVVLSISITFDAHG